MAVRCGDCKVRFARKTDLEGIARLKYEGDEYHTQFDLWPPECEMGEARRTTMKHLADSHSKIFVAVDGTSEIIGFILTSIKKRDTRHSNYRHIGEIGFIYVKQDHWRSGVGTALVNRAVDYFESKGIVHVTLRVVAPNVRGIGFWESLSFDTKVLAKTTTVDRIRERSRAV